MARLRPSAARDDLFDAVDEMGNVLATGTLEVELIAGAQRHGSLQFVTPALEVNTMAAEEMARRAG